MLGTALAALLTLLGCGSPPPAVVEGHYDGGFPDGAHYERLTVQVVTEDETGRILGRAWLQRGEVHTSVPVVSGVTIEPGEDGGRGEAIMLLLQHEDAVSTLYAVVGKSGRRLEGVFNGRGGGSTISLRRLRTPAAREEGAAERHAPAP